MWLLYINNRVKKKYSTFCLQSAFMGHRNKNDYFFLQIDLFVFITIDQLDVTCFIISLLTAQHVSNVSTSIFRSLRLIVDLFRVLYCSGSMCVGVTVWFGWGGVVSLCRLKRYTNTHRTRYVIIHTHDIRIYSGIIITHTTH